MPRQKRPRLNFYKRERRAPTVVKLQCCVVCYSEFHPYHITPSRWESSITELFYSALGIPPLKTGDDEEGEDDSVVSLPYCPQCHTKISLMFNLRCQLESIEHQYECVRNEIAFLVVETITQNCRNGPMDFIRQQIYEKWRDYHESEKVKESYGDNIGLDAMFVGYQNRPAENEVPQEETNMDVSAISDLRNVKTENISNTEESHESTGHEEFDNMASMMEMEMKDGLDYENQMRMQHEDEQQYPQINNSLAPNAVHTLTTNMAKYSQAKTVDSSSFEGLDSNAVHSTPPAMKTQKSIPRKGRVNSTEGTGLNTIRTAVKRRYSQQKASLQSTEGLESNENFMSDDAEAAAVASESVKGFTRVTSIRGRGGGRAKRGLITNGHFESEAAALASESVKGFTRVTSVRGRGRGRRGFGTMPRLIPMGGQANQTTNNTNSRQSPLKFLRGGRSSRAVVRQNHRSGSVINESKNSVSPASSSTTTTTATTTTNSTAPTRPGKVGLSCHVCKKKFPYVTLLKLHFLTHEKPFSHVDKDSVADSEQGAR